MSNRYRLIDRVGEDLGPLISKSGPYRAGQLLRTAGGELYRIHEVVTAQPQDDFVAYLVVAHTKAP
jgi:hypothetical protein